jgi:hypothetical protein
VGQAAGYSLPPPPLPIRNSPTQIRSGTGRLLFCVYYLLFEAVTSGTDCGGERAALVRFPLRLLPETSEQSRQRYNDQTHFPIRFLFEDSLGEFMALSLI